MMATCKYPNIFLGQMKTFVYLSCGISAMLTAINTCQTFFYMSWHRCNLPKQMIIPIGLRRLYPFFVSAPPRGSRTISTPSGQILKWWINSFVWVLSSAKDSFRFGSTFEIPKCFSFNPISLMLANQETYNTTKLFFLRNFSLFFSSLKYQ